MGTDTARAATKGLPNFATLLRNSALPCLTSMAQTWGRLCTVLGLLPSCQAFETHLLGCRPLPKQSWETHSEGYICSETREFLYQIRTTLGQRAGDAPNLSLLTLSLRAVLCRCVWAKPVSCGNLMLQICFETQQENVISLDEGISSLSFLLRDYQMCHETQNFSNTTHSFWSGNFLLSMYMQRCLLNIIKICRRYLFLRSC